MFRAFRHARREHRVQGGIQVRPAQPDRGQRKLEVAVDDVGGIVGVERPDAGQQPVQRAGQRVLIGAVAQWRAGHLLRRGIGQCGGEHAGLGQVGGVFAQPGDAEIGEEDSLALPAAGPGQHDVGGLDVPVQHSHAVRVIQRVRDAFDDLHGPLGRQRQRVHRRRVDPVDVLHGDPQLTVLGATVVHRDDAGMIQLRGQVGLALEARSHLVVQEQLTAEELERGAPGQSGVPREIDRTHSALPEQPFHGESREHLTATEQGDPLPVRNSQPNSRPYRRRR